MESIEQYIEERMEHVPHDEMFPNFPALLLLLLIKAFEEGDAPTGLHRAVWDALGSNELRTDRNKYMVLLNSLVSSFS